MKLVVYTVHVSETIQLKDPLVVHPDVDYICFTDAKIATSSIWQRHPVESVHKDATRTARRYKLLPHRYLPSYDVSIYHDANFQINRDPFEILNNVLGDGDLAIHRHSSRSSVYEEIDKCIEFYKDSKRILRQQENEYRKRNIPDSIGLYETGILIRRHSETIEALGERWWQELCTFSKRDQVSLPIVLAEIPVELRIFPYADIRKNPDFLYSDAGMRPDRRYLRYIAMRGMLGMLKRKILFYRE